MKVALVHDDLIQFGGAERVLMAMHELWPDAPIYTTSASKKWKQKCKKEGIGLKTSFMQRLPFVEKLNRYYSPFLLHILAFESFDFSEYDLVISSSTRFAHGITTKPGTKHICYMNSPGRMFWEPNNYFEKESYGFLKPIKALAKPFLSLPLSHIRQWDFIAAQRVDHFIANSKLPKERIKKYYGRDSKIIYPFVDYERFVSLKSKDENYFVVLTRLASWKKVEIAIEVCNNLGKQLYVLGGGPDLGRLKKLAAPTVKVLGHVSDKSREKILAGCTAVIVTQKEDFGIVPLEAMATGKPVIAYGAGGVLETVIEGETGLFFKEQTAEALEVVMKGFKTSAFNSEKCKKQAKLFEKSVFLNELKAFVSDLNDSL